ncbi:MAG: SRPBCC domain-containing protein [Alphaproteobacteria bacterium]|nr:SRPBCC domain-containing protein [Alphaproteobacteria bacterium]
MAIPRYEPKSRVLPKAGERRVPSASPRSRPVRRLSLGMIGFVLVLGIAGYALVQARGTHRMVETVIDIAAPRDKVWAILSDFSAYGDWNPYFTSVEGVAEAGAQLRVTHGNPGGEAIQIQPKIQRLIEPQEMRWLVNHWPAGLLDGHHVILLESLSVEATRLHQAERFSGLLAAFGSEGLFEKAREGFEAMNAALKARAESP